MILRRGVWLLLPLPVLAASAVVMWASNRGLDLTDESYYLLWIQDPHHYKASTTQFGFVYHPLWILVGGKIAALRAANVLITLALGTWASWLVLSRGMGRRSPWLPQVAVAVGFGATALMAISPWLLTPSYNTLTAQATLVIVGGVALAWWTPAHAPSAHRRAIVAGAIVGLGGVLLFLAKPPAAVVVGLPLALVLWFHSRTGRVVSAVAAITAPLLLVSFALLVDGSVIEFIHGLIQAGDDDQALNPAYTFSRALGLQRPHPSITHGIIASAITGAAYLGTEAALGVRPVIRRWCLLGALGFVAVGAALVIRTPATLSMTFENTGESVVFLGLPLGAALAAWRIGRHTPRGGDLVLACVLVALSYGGSLGAANAYWYMASLAPLPIVLAALLLLLPLARQHGLVALIPFAVACEAILIATLVVNAQAPYRLAGPVWKADSEVRVGDGGRLLIHPVTAKALRNVQREAARLHFAAGTPLIDITGESPGAVLALGATAPGTPWLLGGYPGSEGYARRQLQSASCAELSHAWLLGAAPVGDRPLGQQVVAAYGATPKEYVRIAPRDTASAPEESLGAWEFWRPGRSAASLRALCHRARG